MLQFDGTTAADLSHRYLWGPVVDQLLADETVDDGGTEDVLWALTDWQGSVRHLASYDESTSTTSIENHKFYDAYGNVTSETNSAVDTIFGYTGRMWDDDIDLQNNLNRWYDSGVGRWLTEDPIGFAAGDPNLYRYVGNSPGMGVDPSGLAEVYGPPAPVYGPSASNADLNIPHAGVVLMQDGSVRVISPQTDGGTWRQMQQCDDGGCPISSTLHGPGFGRPGGLSEASDSLGDFFVPPYTGPVPARAPSGFDQFRWGGTTGGDLTEWFNNRYPGHTSEAKRKARLWIEDYIRSGGRSATCLEKSKVHSVRPDHDNSERPLEWFFRAPDDFGETEFGDQRQTPFEANGTGPGGFSYCVENVIVTEWEDGCFRWHADLVVRDELGMSRGDPTEENIVWKGLGARKGEVVVRARWRLSGSCICE